MPVFNISRRFISKKKKEQKEEILRTHFIALLGDAHNSDVSLIVDQFGIERHDLSSLSVDFRMDEINRAVMDLRTQKIPLTLTDLHGNSITVVGVYNG